MHVRGEQSGSMDCRGEGKDIIPVHAGLSDDDDEKVIC